MHAYWPSLSEMFTVVAINTVYHQFSGLTLIAGQSYTATNGRKAGHYSVLIGDVWYCVNADWMSVVE